MQQLYLVRHGNADYMRNCLTESGQEQIRSLSGRLRDSLPDKRRYSLITSPSRRAYQTAEALLPLLELKSEMTIQIHQESCFGELEGYVIGSKNALEKGFGKIPTIRKYLEQSDVLFVTSHKRVISATSLALAQEYDIEFSDTFKPRVMMPDNEILIELTMGRRGLERDAAIQWLIDAHPETFLHPPGIPEAAAIHFDLEGKVVEMLR